MSAPSTPLGRHQTDANLLEYTIKNMANPETREQNKQKLIYDMHMSSVAHSIKNAKCGAYKLLTGKNGLAPRVCRFFNEPGYYVENNAIDKYIIAVNILLLVMTIVTLVMMYTYSLNNVYTVKSKTTYESKLKKIDDLVDKYEGDLDQKIMYKVKLLSIMGVDTPNDLKSVYVVDDMNSVFNSTPYNLAKFVMSSSVVVLMAWNIFKRTTAICDAPAVPASERESVSGLVANPLITNRRR